MGERKTIDVDTATYNGDTTGSVQLLNGVAAGTDFTDRIGRKIIMRSLFIRGLVFPNDDTSSHQLVRVVVVYDMQSNGAAPTIANVYKAVDGLAQVNLNNRDRFKILVDKTFAVAKVDNSAGASWAGSPTTHKFKIYKRLKHEVLFNGTTAAIGSIATGSVYLLTFGTSPSATGSYVMATSRIRFEDG